MTFPTSGLVDNQVHKEGNRSFVWDDTLEVWDQAPEAPETISILGAGKGLDDVTLGTGTLGSSVVFPAGHVIQKVILAQDFGNSVPDIGGNVGSFTDTGVAGSFTTKMSSADSMLFFNLFSGSGYLQLSTAFGYTTLALTTASNTTYAEANDTLGDQTHKAKVTAVANRAQPDSWVWMYKVGTRIPSGLASYTAGQTLYARIFYMSSNTGSYHRIVVADNDYLFTVEEVQI